MVGKSIFSPLDRKLGRDLWRMRGQALAIILVVGLGVLMLVMMDGLVNSLEETKRAYYERYRLAQIFAPVKRAPQSVLQDLAKIPGVATVQGRVNGGALINLPGVNIPLQAQAISLPELGRPLLNDIYLSAGRMIDPSQENEILLLESFAIAHNLSPGDSIAATMMGSRREFFIVGLAQAPEFLYSAPPGEMMPDDARFAVIWMGERALEAAFDLKGAVNEVLFSLTKDAQLPAVLAAIDRQLANYGGLGAYGLKDHISNRFIQEEIDGLKVSRKVVPPIFLAIAAFLLYIVIARMIEAEREQIGLLKAFGYTSFEISAHYFKFVLFVALGGAALGCVFGVISGRNLVGVYQVYYKFPFLVFQVDPRAFISALFVSIFSASAGSLFVLKNIFKLSPAVAMRAAAPKDYSHAVNFGQFWRGVLDQPTRMIIRRLLRQPGRALLAISGIAAGMSLSVSMLGVLGGFDEAMELNFTVMDRSDANVSFIEPLSDKTLYNLKNIEGVLHVEPVRHINAILRHNQYRYRGGISGLTKKPQLNRAIDKQMQPIFMKENGVILSKPIAKILHVQIGDTITIEARQGRRPIFEVPVIGIAETLMGSPIYMELNTLNRYMKEPNRVSGAYLKIDEQHSDAIYKKLKDMPAVAGVSLKSQARDAFQKMMDQGAGAMRFIMAIIAGLITFGIVYNSARIAYAERARDLASLRVLGFTRAEAAFVLLGELALITLLALPIGAAFGYYLSQSIAEGFSTDLYQIPATIGADSFGVAILAVTIAAIFSGWIVKRDLNKIDLVSALKTRE